jgi:predicted amidohydrolase YtcJ
MGNRIAWVGPERDLAGLSPRRTKVIDCRGGTVVPGLIDAHCHVLAYASSLLAVDCGPNALGSISDIKTAIRGRARSTPPGGWVRGSGYDDFSLVEKRHPTRWDLDEAAPGHPVKLNHLSGHACVLNTAALSIAGISIETADPTPGVIDRDPRTGEPTGLLLDMNEYLQDRVPRLGDAELDQGLRLANRRLVSRGITSVQDAGAFNSVEEWDRFVRLKSEGRLEPRVTMMAGARRLDGFLDRGMGFGWGDDHLSLGAAKVMLTATSGRLSPDRDELRHIVAEARRHGFQVAVHAVEAEAVEVAIEAQSLDIGPATDEVRRDRIEHCSECPPELLAKLADSGLIVVTQPGFIFESGRRYLSEVDGATLPWLYRAGSLVEAGVTMAAGSDAPVADPDPFAGMYAAVTRRARTGEPVGVEERVGAETALRMHTSGGAYAAFQETDRGTIEAGKLADLAVLDRDPTAAEPTEMPETGVMMTVIGGRVVWGE